LLIAGTPTGAARYNWTPAFVAQWLVYLNAWLLLDTDYQDKKGGYTTDGKNDMLAIIGKLVLYAEQNKLIELIRATVGLTSIDCSTWNLPANLALPVHGGHLVEHATEATDRSFTKAEAVYPKMTPKAGGMVHIEAFTAAAQSGRPHKEKGYDTIEYMSAVFYSGTANLPTSAADPRLHLGHGTHANFILATAADIANLPALAAGAVAPAKILIIFFRWAKSKHPTEDGPWCGVFTTVLL
jgi:hypothetical protein